MNTELPPFKNGEHNSGSASTIERVITPLKEIRPPSYILFHQDSSNAIIYYQILMPEQPILFNNAWRKWVGKIASA